MRAEYFAFILEAVRGKDLNKPFSELQIMYGISGERDLTERTIDHLSGWRDSKPVRVGNGAWNQHQNDVWGMLIDAVDSHLHRGAEQIIDPVWEGLAGFVEDAIKHAGDADQGIWEIRGEPQHFTQSAVMCWLAADRGADLAQERGDTERATRWQQAADALKADILDKGVDEKGRFRQAYENDELDASLLLLLPIMGFLPPDDERIKATVLAIASELTEDSLVLRYKVDTTDTGFSGKEGTFTICSWWLVSALAMIGETDRARALCKKLLSYAGPLNLYTEEIDTSTGPSSGRRRCTGSARWACPTSVRHVRAAQNGRDVLELMCPFHAAEPGPGQQYGAPLPQPRTLGRHGFAARPVPVACAGLPGGESRRAGKSAARPSGTVRPPAISACATACPPNNRASRRGPGVPAEAVVAGPAHIQ